jgi:hypothetical protein
MKCPQQKVVDQVVIGCMRRDVQSLRAVLADRRLIDAHSSVGLAPLFGACYTLWPSAVRRLLAVGADPYEVGLGSALDAVELGLRDGGRDAQSRKKARQIVAMLRRRGVQPAAH